MKWIEETAAKVLDTHADQGLKHFATGCIMLHLLHKLKAHIKYCDVKFLAKHHHCCCLLVKLIKPSPDDVDETCKEFQFIKTRIWTVR